MKDRVKALKKVQFETIKVEEEYYKEIHAIDLKYQKQYDEINAKRLKIIRYKMVSESIRNLPPAN